jgi:hypothetical protein
MELHQKAPDAFPMEMSAADWEMQFRLWDKAGCQTPKGQTAEHRAILDEITKAREEKGV